MKGNKTMQETNQPRLIRDQPLEKVNPCGVCGNYPQLCESPDGSFSLKCSCGTEAKFFTNKLEELGLHLLKSLWNIESTRGEISEATRQVLDVNENDFLVYDLRDYSLLKVFTTLFDAMKYMKNRFNEDMEQRTTLFQLQKNELVWVLISDQL